MLGLFLAGGCGIPPSSVVAVPPPPPVEKSAVVQEDEKPKEEEEERPMLDAWEMIVNEDGAAFRAGLKEAGFKFQALPERKERDRSGCGIPHGVVVLKGPTGSSRLPGASHRHECASRFRASSTTTSSREPTEEPSCPSSVTR